MTPSRIFWLKQQSKHVAEVSVRDLDDDAETDEIALKEHSAGQVDSARTAGNAVLSVALGLDANVVESVNWQAALRRVLHDTRSDFIWAPHLKFIYSHAGEELIREVKSELGNHSFYTRPVLSIEVPKSYRIKVAGASKRLGPSFTRPGSIPSPKDRLLYQVLADDLSVRIEQATDRSRSFSHRLAEPEAETMFVSNRECWSQLQAAVRSYAQLEEIKYILRLDIANYFGSLNLKTLVSAFDDVGFDNRLSDVLGKLLLSFSGGDGSRGIIQGVYPSDMLGMFYMNPVDQLFDDLDIRSARYVDDLYIFVGSVDEADAVMRRLIPFLRSYDLNLNEVKSSVFPKRLLFSEEPDLEELFQNAVDEISEQLDEETSATEYGFQKEWDDEENYEQGENVNLDIELQATSALFSSITEFPGSEEAIERFCLPLFAKTGSDSALNHVLESLGRRPSMAQIYANYLARFVKQDPRVETRLLEAIEDISFYDWQKMWLLACLMQAGRASPKCLKIAASLMADPLRHDALRAVAALIVGKFGDVSRRRALADAYKSVSEYVQLAIYFASRNWPPEERASATKSWSGHGPLHRLMASGLASL
ncbi:RNA-directed DNA polymerase [Mesorhizobium sp.]|uniref:RNA-directed DNA polymerase n=1 Tax=Mesorhizobium sp. TaxID=1871066 RepID=UPI0025803BDE|nr:RNA-directed DNA polymerase [Mesorhizobium sp.]